MKHFLTIEEASSYLKLSKNWLYKLTYLNKIPVYRLGRGLRFLEEELSRWIELGGNEHAAARVVKEREV